MFSFISGIFFFLIFLCPSLLSYFIPGNLFLFFFFAIFAFSSFEIPLPFWGEDGRVQSLEECGLFLECENFLSPNSITVERNLASHSLRRGKDRKSDRMFTRHWSGIDDVHASTLNRKEIPRNVYGSLDSRQEVTLEEVTTSDWPTE